MQMNSPLFWSGVILALLFASIFGLAVESGGSLGHALLYCGNFFLASYVMYNTDYKVRA